MEGGAHDGNTVRGPWKSHDGAACWCVGALCYRCDFSLHPPSLAAQSRCCCCCLVTSGSPLWMPSATELCGLHRAWQLLFSLNSPYRKPSVRCQKGGFLLSCSVMRKRCCAGATSPVWWGFSGHKLSRHEKTLPSERMLQRGNKTCHGPSRVNFPLLDLLCVNSSPSPWPSLELFLASADSKHQPKIRS